MKRNLHNTFRSFIGILFLLLASGFTSLGQFVEQSYTCGDTWYDSGGPDGNYGTNQLYVYTICPQNPGEYVSVLFTGVSIAGGDNMIVLNGAESNAPLIGNFGGTFNRIFTSSAADGCLTFIFQSNYTTVADGWTATVSCVDTPGSNTAVCTDANCIGGCLTYICGTQNVDFVSLGQGAEELNDLNRGCLGPLGENCAKWFFLNPVIPGTLSLNLTTNGGQDQDFAIWEGYAPSLDCPVSTGASPIRCNYVGMNNTGTGTGITTPAANNDAWHEPVITITQADIDAGIYFMMLVETYNPGGSCPSPTVNMDFTGTTDGLLSCDPIVLPTNLISFDGIPYVNGNYLSWRTASERQLSHYQIERSFDGIKWSIISNMNAVGNSSTEQYYYYIDNNDLTPNNLYYYRLKMYDIDGSNSFSEIISVKNATESGDVISNISPNPSSSYFSFQYNGISFDESVQMQITNNIGQSVYKSEFDLTRMSNIGTIDISFLNDGVYFVSFYQFNEQINNQKLVIIK
jgi:hypothetical protein